MNKISGVIPTSTRQTWITGEVDKPKRLSVPTPEDEAKAKSLRPLTQVMTDEIAPIQIPQNKFVGGVMQGNNLDIKI